MPNRLNTKNKLTPYYDSVLPKSMTGARLDRALALGWYRSQQALFTCSHVNLGGIYRVHWLRYRLHEIIERASHNKIRKRSAAFTCTCEDFNPDFVRPDHSELHTRYRASIDFDGARSIAGCLLGEDYDGVNVYDTKCLSLFDGDKLIAAGYFDVGLQTAASILHFFDPAYKRFSLGKYLILLTLDFMRANHLSLYYPGYLVQGLSKMDYKLFLGKQSAQYFDPETISWKYFEEKILLGGPELDLTTEES
jgi:leucyl-tRNA---protein transferase